LAVHVLDVRHFRERRDEIVFENELPLKQQLAETNHFTLLFLEGLCEVRRGNIPAFAETLDFSGAVCLFFATSLETSSCGFS
jgi:hypothetical protein